MDFGDFNTKCDKTIEIFAADLQKVRTGRAHPSFLDQVMVSYYGTPTPLKQVANVVNEDAKTLSVTPWEISLITAVGKAIDDSNLGIKAQVSSDRIRVGMPMLTTERRQELIKVVKADAEKARVGVRQNRRQMIQQLKKDQDQGLVTEDELRKAEAELQKLTDAYISKIDLRLLEKQNELEEV